MLILFRGTTLFICLYSIPLTRNRNHAYESPLRPGRLAWMASSASPGFSSSFELPLIESRCFSCCLSCMILRRPSADIIRCKQKTSRGTRRYHGVARNYIKEQLVHLSIGNYLQSLLTS